jgi:RNA polymerase sigma-70 factor (ECF subfamily)
VHTKNYHHTTDQQLLDAFYENGNTRLLGVLLQRYTLLLLGVCMKYLKNEEVAKDAVQQIFLKVIGELKRYKVKYFKSWLYMIAKNYCLMQLRNKNNIMSAGLNENLITEEETDLQKPVQKEKLFSALESAVEELNNEQKLCINLFYLEKRSYQQICDLTGFNLMQVKSFIQNGKRNLKLLVEKKLRQQ